MDASFTGLRPGPRNLITDVAGLSVGNAEDAHALTGATVVLCQPRATAGVDMRGGAPGTRETDVLDPVALVDGVDAVVLSGGSVYGLEAASAVTVWLGARGRGFRLRPDAPPAPIVPAAILFDLANGGDKSWGEAPPYGALGRKACAAAGEVFSLGNSGAGLGAIAGPVKGGLGSASVVDDAGLVVGALAAVNALGSPVAPGTATFWAQPFELGGEFGGPARRVTEGVSALPPFSGTKLSRHGADAAAHTTIAVVATNAALSVTEATRVAIMAHDGLARALRPAHTPFDGDTVFALATGAVGLPEPRARSLAGLGSLAADTLARAIARAVYEATGIAGIASYRDGLGAADRHK